METFATWCSLAHELGQEKSTLSTQLKDAEAAIHELGLSIQDARERILALMQSDTADAQEICTHERHMLLLGRELFKKRAAVIRVAIAHCLEGVKQLNTQLRSSEAAPSCKSLDLLRALRDLIEEELQIPRFHEQALRCLAQEVEICCTLFEQQGPV